MVSERWEQVKAAFDIIVNLDAEGRAVALDQLQKGGSGFAIDHALAESESGFTQRS